MIAIHTGDQAAGPMDVTVLGRAWVWDEWLIVFRSHAHNGTSPRVMMDKPVNFAVTRVGKFSDLPLVDHAGDPVRWLGNVHIGRVSDASKVHAMRLDVLSEGRGYLVGVGRASCGATVEPSGMWPTDMFVEDVDNACRHCARKVIRAHDARVFKD